MRFKNWFIKEEEAMQWNELKILPEDDKVILLHVKQDASDVVESICTGKFNIAKGWRTGLGTSFSQIPDNFSVLKWMEIPLP